jgi:zinc-ribbon family
MIFGSKVKQLSNEARPNLSCPHCNTTGKMTVGVVNKYFHVMFIPTFPTGKTGFSQCGHCKQILEEKDMPANIRSEVFNIKQDSKTPYWMYSGLFGFALLMVFGSISGKKNDAENAQFIDAPAVGDKYHIKNDFRDFTIYRVNNVTADSIYFDLNNYSVTKRRGLYKIDKEENYVPGGAMSKAAAKQLFEAHTIEDIVR